MLEKKCLLFVVVAVLTLITIGCSQGSADSIESSSTNPEVDSKGPEKLLLENNFGTQPPNQELFHTFKIKNSTDRKWTIANVQTSCACTTSDVSANTVEPQGSIDVLVKYRTSNELKNDKKVIRVNFKELYAPEVHLIVSSFIRKKLTVLPSRLIESSVGKSDHFVRNLVVYSYLDQTDQTPLVQSNADWLVAEIVGRKSAENLSADSSNPTYAWDLRLSIDTEKMEYGLNQANVLFEVNETDLEVKIPIGIVLTQPIKAIPRILFFDELKEQETAKQSIWIKFSSDALPRDASEIVINHNLGTSFHWEWSKREKSAWQLEVSLKPDNHFIAKYEDKDYFQETLQLIQQETGSTLLKIPVKGRLLKKESK